MFDEEDTLDVVPASSCCERDPPPELVVEIGSSSFYSRLKQINN